LVPSLVSSWWASVGASEELGNSLGAWEDDSLEESLGESLRRELGSELGDERLGCWALLVRDALRDVVGLFPFFALNDVVGLFSFFFLVGWAPLIVVGDALRDVVGLFSFFSFRPLLCLLKGTPASATSMSASRRRMPVFPRFTSAVEIVPEIATKKKGAIA
jgi:hypothetical protein